MNLSSTALAVAGRVPAAVWRPASLLGGHLVALRPPRPVRQWQLNARAMTGQDPTRAETARAVASWARNLFESVQLEHWSTQQVLDAVVIDPADVARLQRLHRERGVVVALPHLASWDLAGAWACLSGLPVATVAEQVPAFDRFVRAREALGMRVHGHREHLVTARLADDLREGWMVCLLADRHFGRGGVDVDWPVAGGSVRRRLPAGPAHLALATGAALVGAAGHYDGRRMRLVVSEPFEGDDVAALTQQVADFLAGEVSRNVVDWHVLVPVLPGLVA